MPVELGPYFQEDITINGVKVTGANMAVDGRHYLRRGGNGDADILVIGLGPVGRESTRYVFGRKDGSTFSRDDRTYDNFPIQLYRQGQTQSVSYSLWMSSPKEQRAQLIFGGIDHSKYSGSIYTVPIERGIVPEMDDIDTHFFTLLDEMKVNLGNADSMIVLKGSFPILIDPTSSDSSVPEDVYTALSAIFSGDGGSLLPCTPPAGNLSITIRGQEFFVPLQALIRQALSPQGEPYTYESGEPQCELGVSRTTNEDADARAKYMTFGMSILQGLHLTFDLDNHEIGIAQSNWSPSDKSIEDITNGIPSARKASGYSSIKDATPTYSLNTQRPTTTSHTSTSTSHTTSTEATTTAESARPPWPYPSTDYGRVFNDKGDGVLGGAAFLIAFVFVALIGALIYNIFSEKALRRELESIQSSLGPTTNESEAIPITKE